ILRYRIGILSFIILITAFMAYKAFDARMAYTYAQMLPETDTTFVEHLYFKQVFGEEANMFAIGVKDPNFFNKDRFNDYSKLSQEIKSQYGITDVLSVGQVVNPYKNDSLQIFEFKKIFPQEVQTQEELDSLTNIFKSLSFYDGLVYNGAENVFLFAVTLDKDLLNTEKRIGIVDNVHKIADEFAEKHNVELHYSGLPYIRTEISKKIKEEIKLFIVLAFLVTATILFLFFRSFKAVIFSLLIVGIGVVWSIGTLGLLNYEITILTGMIPPVLIIIGVPNSIFMLNKYHTEYKRHGNKIKALQRVISKVGNAVFLSNLTTAAGFATFILTSSGILIEFGIVASLNIMAMFLIAVCSIPIIFSFLPPPKYRHIKHLEKRRTTSIIDKLETISIKHRPVVFIVTLALIVTAIFGISRIHTTGYMVDDIPPDDPILTDLKFFEKHFDGVMPVEILIDTKEPQGAFKLETLKKLDALQDSLLKYPELSKPYSLAEAAKLLRQSYYDGDPRRYRVPIERERLAMAKYLKTDEKQKNILTNFLDSGFQITRMTLRMHDIGTVQMESATQKIENDIKSVFPDSLYHTILTGTSIVFAKGTQYLIKNLFTSLAIAVAFISLVFLFLLRSWRMALIGLIPNLIPQLMTAALMGYFGIPIKPSTILIFSIAFGISVDNTIHFLSKYMQEMKVLNWNTGESVKAARREVGISMMYTSTVLLFGFAIFAASEFGGTKALGTLVGLTLFFAMISNLIILPTLLLTFEKTITTKAFKQSALQMPLEDEKTGFDNNKN
ncbi:MAG TPA: MMPL family transporter, partial [Salinivirgaceae bacterium]|nr:MMPL family transporter [Salinivirgaceae bacterium]